jgi:phosphoribosylaminoimidazole carboxylase PurE protein
MTSSPVVSVLMGSNSDNSHMEAAYTLLDEFGIPWEKQVLSAHRQPERLRSYLAEAEQKGIKVFIAAAGLSAALPGVVASHTIQPVIGVPVPAGPLKGVDALLSIVQMPGGIPVATVGLGSNGPKNAALLAVEMLSLGDEGLRARLRKYREKLSGD